ncbi:MAG: protein kinase [Gemmataceae bacterium]|nr:protein kinase [Gemmataceae bacterium]
MPNDPVLNLVDVLRQFRLLEAAQLEEATRNLQPRLPDPRQLARELLQRGWLTAYQVNQLLQGRGAELVVGGFVLLERIGEGGMGQVFKARHQKLGRIVALKVIRKDRLASAEAVKRFHREIQAVSQLSHPNVVLAYDANHAGETHFFAMEYVEGIDLARWVKEHGPTTVPDACEYIRQAACGLAHAHERGLVHRDIKPSNVMLTAEAVKGVRPASGPLVKLMDLGLARLSAGSDEESSTTLTQDGSVIGTPDYIAPEQARNSRNADIRADLYSLGCTFYYVLTGQVPFAGGTMTEKLLKHHYDAATPIEKLRPEVPPGIRAIIGKLMAKKPEDRFQTPDELVAALEAARKNGNARTPHVTRTPNKAVKANGTLPRVAQASAGSRLKLANLRAGPRWWIFAGAAVAMLLVVLLGATWALWPSGSKFGPGTKPGAVVEDPIGSPLDNLAGRFARDQWVGWQAPDELVAVMGEHNGRHFGPVRALAFTGDGTQLISGGQDWALRVWHAQTLQERKAVRNLGAAIVSIALLPKSSRVALGMGDGTVRIYELGGPQPRELQSFNAHQGAVYSIAASPDARVLASAGQDRTIRLWALSPGGGASKGPALEEHRDAVHSLAFCVDGKTLASGSADRSVLLWDMTQTPPKPRGEPLWHKSTVNAVAFAPDGHLLATAGEMGTIQLWDGQTGKPRDSTGLSKLGGMVYSLAFAQDGKILVAGDSYGYTATYEILNDGVRARGRLDGAATVTAVAGHGNSFASATHSGAIRVCDISGRPVERRLGKGHQGAATALAFVPGSSTLASAGADSNVILWNLEGAEPREQERLASQLGGLSSLAISPDSKRLAVGSPNRNTIRLWEVQGTRPLREWPPLRVHDHGVFALAFSPDSKTLATGGLDDKIGRARLVDVSGTEAKLGKPMGSHMGSVTAVTFAAGGRMLATSSASQEDWTVDLTDFASGREDRRIPSNPATGAPTAMAVSPDGRTLVSTRSNGWLRLWDVSQSQPRELETLKGPHQYIVWSAAFSPDGKTLASVSAEGKLVLWDWAAAKPCREWMLPGSGLGVAYAPDGRHVAVALADGTIFILRVAKAK